MHRWWLSWAVIGPFAAWWIVSTVLFWFMSRTIDDDPMSWMGSACFALVAMAAGNLGPRYRKRRKARRAKRSR